MGEALADEISDACAALRRGGVIVLPTETVYGLAALPDRPDAVSRIYEIKGRPKEKVLQLLVAVADAMDLLARPSIDARKLAEAFWPGPLTLILPAGSDAPIAVAGDGNIGLRVPAHAVALDMLARCGPLAATSANRSGEASPPTVPELREMFADGVDVYLDGGRIDPTVSTVIDMTTDRPIIKREGAIDTRVIESVVGFRFEVE